MLYYSPVFVRIQRVLSLPKIKDMERCSTKLRMQMTREFARARMIESVHSPFSNASGRVKHHICVLGLKVRGNIHFAELLERHTVVGLSVGGGFK